MQRFGPSSRLVTIGRVNALVVFKGARDLLSAAAATWTLGVASFCVIQDHPVHIPVRTAMAFFVPRLPQVSSRDDWQLRSVSISRRHPGQLTLRLSPALPLDQSLAGVSVDRPAPSARPWPDGVIEYLTV